MGMVIFSFLFSLTNASPSLPSSSSLLEVYAKPHRKKRNTGEREKEREKKRAREREREENGLERKGVLKC